LPLAEEVLPLPSGHLGVPVVQEGHREAELALVAALEVARAQLCHQELTVVWDVAPGAKGGPRLVYQRHAGLSAGRGGQKGVARLTAQRGHHKAVAGGVIALSTGALQANSIAGIQRGLWLSTVLLHSCLQAAHKVPVVGGGARDGPAFWRVAGVTALWMAHITQVWLPRVTGQPAALPHRSCTL